MKKIGSEFKYADWLNQPVTCPVTGSTYKLEEDDLPLTEENGHLVCPDCSGIINFVVDKRDASPLLAHS